MIITKNNDKNGSFLYRMRALRSSDRRLQPRKTLSVIIQTCTTWLEFYDTPIAVRRALGKCASKNRYLKKKIQRNDYHGIILLIIFFYYLWVNTTYFLTCRRKWKVSSDISKDFVMSDRYLNSNNNCVTTILLLTFYVNNSSVPSSVA